MNRRPDPEPHWFSAPGNRDRRHAAESHETDERNESRVSPTSDPMIAVRLRLSITPWDDADFVHAVEDACQRATLSNDVEPYSIAAAEHAERDLRDRGYHEASVIDVRTLDEAVALVGHWQVHRDGRPMTPPPRKAATERT